MNSIAIQSEISIGLWSSPDSIWSSGSSHIQPSMLHTWSWMSSFCPLAPYIGLWFHSIAAPIWYDHLGAPYPCLVVSSGRGLAWCAGNPPVWISSPISLLLDLVWDPLYPLWSHWIFSCRVRCSIWTCLIPIVAPPSPCDTIGSYFFLSAILFLEVLWCNLCPSLPSPHQIWPSPCYYCNDGMFTYWWLHNHLIMMIEWPNCSFWHPCWIWQRGLALDLLNLTIFTICWEAEWFCPHAILIDTIACPSMTSFYLGESFSSYPPHFYHGLSILSAELIAAISNSHFWLPRVPRSILRI